EGEAAIQVPALVTFGTDIALRTLAKYAECRGPVAVGGVVADAKPPIGAEQVGDTALDKGGGEATGKVFKTERCLEVANRDQVRPQARVLDPGVAHPATAAVRAAGTC